MGFWLAGEFKIISYKQGLPIPGRQQNKSTITF